MSIVTYPRRGIFERSKKAERTILNPIKPSKVTGRFSTRNNVVRAQGILRRRERDRPNGRPGIFEISDDSAQGAGDTGFQFERKVLL